MIVYRVVKKDSEFNISNDQFSGDNTFNYSDGQAYLHFFILPESAEIYQLLKYQNNGEDSIIVQCDIPYPLLEGNFGCGMYRWYHLKARSPFLEVRIKREDFDNDMIVDISDRVKPEWKNETIYQYYLDTCVNINSATQLSFKDDKAISTLNDDFPFLHYFPKEQLARENIVCDDYPHCFDSGLNR